MSYDPTEDQVSIETPEHIRLDYELGGIGSRFLAGFLDTLIQTALVVGIAVAVNLISFFQRDVWHMPLSAVVVIASTLLIVVGYFVLFEMIWDGQSPGKRMAGLRVIRADGTPITITDSLIRNIMRFIDLLPLYYTVGIIAIFFSRRSQRLGDLAAGTIVVKERMRDLPAALPAPPAAAGAFPPAPGAAVLPPPPIPAPTEILVVLREGVGCLTPQELATLDRFIERRFELDPQARYRLSQQIAAPLRAHFPALQPGDLPMPEHFLEVLHAVWRERERTR